MKNERQNLPIASLLAFLLINLLSAWQVYASTLRSGKTLIFFSLMSLLSMAALAALARSVTLGEKLANLFDKTFQRRVFVLISAGFIFTAGWVFLSLTAETRSNYIIVAQPAINWLVINSALIFFSLAAWGISKHSISKTEEDVVRASLIIFALFVALITFMAATGLGLERVGYYWYAPGTPILIGQVLLALLAGAGVWAFQKTSLSQKIPSSRLDLGITLLLTLLASAVWLLEPMTRATNFLPSPKPPNYETYPDSDSAYIDINAQRPLVGQPLSVDPADKPTYSFLLYILHLLAGQDYTKIINLQVVVLAIIPAIFYHLLATGFFSRPIGLAAALLFILREKSSIALTNIILVSHPKLLLSDVPSAGLMILLALLLVGWMRQPDQRRTWPMWFGIVFAAFLLLRTQIILLAPLIILWAFFVMWQKHRRALLEAALLAVLGFAAFSLPSGLYGVGAPASANTSAYTRQLAIQFQFDPLKHNVRPLAGESESAFNTRMREQVIQFVRKNPAFTLKAISAYFFRNLAQSMLYLPASSRLEVDPTEYIHRLPYWEDWTGGLPRESQIIFVFNLFAIALGLAAAWKKFGLAGLTPLLFYLGYLASLAIPMISGWRFLLPGDWVLLLYYLLGIAQACNWALAGLGQKSIAAQEMPIVSSKSTPFPWQKIILIGTLTLLANTSLLAIRAAIPAKYPSPELEAMIEKYKELQTLPGAQDLPPLSDLQEFLRGEDSRMLIGRALYPRFFERGDGFSGNGIISFRPYEFSRLSFYFLGRQNDNIILPLIASPDSFPHATDVLVIGCQRETNYFHKTYTEALLVFLPDESVFLWQSGKQSLDCSN